jgi:hypothetical protein
MRTSLKHLNQDSATEMNSFQVADDGFSHIPIIDISPLVGLRQKLSQKWLQTQIEKYFQLECA